VAPPMTYKLHVNTDAISRSIPWEKPGSMVRLDAAHGGGASLLLAVMQPVRNALDTTTLARISFGGSCSRKGG
jgi:hypothetical protein